MATPSTINWIAATTNTVINYALPGGGAAQYLPFVTGSNVTTYTTSTLTSNPLYPPLPSATAGTTVPFYTMPDYYNRKVVFNSTVNKAANAITLTGFDTFGNALTENLGAITAGTPLISTNAYYKFSAFIIAAQTGTVTAGLSNAGTTGIFTADVWNKANNFSISYNNIVGAVSLTPYITNVPIVTYPKGVQTYIQPYSVNPNLYFALPYDSGSGTSPNQAASPSGAITANQLIANITVPFTGLVTNITATTGSFTQTIMQQGARF